MLRPRPSAHRARALLSQFYRLAGHGNVPREAFLEAALAAALEDPEVWPRFAEASGWARRLGPSHLAAAPVVSTQDWVAGGRTDIRLSWSDRSPVVLELKVTDPPTSQQVETYLAGAHVAAVAKTSVPINVRRHEPFEWLGILTWQFFRDLNWPGAPPVLEQLHQLIDDMEVAVPRITLHGLSGTLSSWDAWNTIDAWSLHASKVIAELWDPAGLKVASRDKRQAPIRFANQRYAYFLWVKPWSSDSQLGAFAGLFAGRAETPPTVAELPDLCLTLHAGPRSRVRANLRANSAFVAAAARWAGRSDGVVREVEPVDDAWEFVRARSSSLALLTAPDQQPAFYEWFQARAEELVADGIIAEVAAAASRAREVGDVDPSGPTDDGPEGTE